MNEKDEELNRQLEAINDSFKLLGQHIAESATAKPIKGEPFIDFKTTKEINDSLTTIQKNTDELKEVVSESLGAVGVQLKDMMSELIPALVNAADRYAYKGIEVKKYCKLRGMSLKELCFCADVKEGTMRTYMNGSRDIPASVLIHISATLGVSTDLLLKKSKREIKLGYMSNQIPLFQYDNDKKEFVRTTLSYSMDNSLKDFLDQLIVYKCSLPVRDLGLPSGTVFFITPGAEAISSINKRVAVFMKKKRKNGGYDEFYSYVQQIKGDEKDYSSAVNYNYTHNGEIFTCTLNQLQSMVQFVIHKAVIDF